MWSPSPDILVTNRNVTYGNITSTWIVNAYASEKEPIAVLGWCMFLFDRLPLEMGANGEC
jgi:hypothetical protein